jgi:large subunit ribosomal protein L35
MPKLKTKKALSKRVKITGSGKMVRKQSHRQHDAWAKTKKQRRQLAKSTTVSTTDLKRLRQLIQH